MGVAGIGQVPGTDAVTGHVAEIEKARTCPADAIGASMSCCRR
ncbi:hypothetical protein [Planomonospora algeriensis]